MAIGQNRVGWVMDLKIDQQSYNQVLSQLNRIKSMTETEFSEQLNFDIGPYASGKKVEEYTKGLERAKESAAKLEEIMQNAFNPRLNSFNLTNLKKEIDAIGGKNGLKNIASDLSRIGIVGNKAFHDFTSQIFTTNVQLKEANKFIKDMSVSMMNTVKWGVTSSIFNNITNSISQAWNYTKKLDTSLTDIRVVTGKSADEMERFALQANKAAQSLGKTTTDYTEASLIYYQQGLSEDEVRSRTEATLKTANVTGQSTSAVSEQLTAVWNGYKVSAQEAELYVDKLAAVAATTAADLEELSTGMSKVASAASLMGVDIDELSAQMATIVSVTRQAPESVGTALKTIYARMGDIEAGLDSEISLGEYTSQMFSLGVNVLDTSGNLRDMGEVITEIGNKWSSMSKEQQIALSQIMAGTRQYNNLLSLFNNWDMYEDALKTSQNALGTLQNQQDIYMESTEAHLEKLSAAWERVYKGLTEKGFITSLIDGLTSLTNVFATLIESMGGFYSSFIFLASTATKRFASPIGEAIATRQLNNRKNDENKEMQMFKNRFAEEFSSKHGEEASDQYLDEMAKNTLELGKYADQMKDVEQEQANSFVKRRARLLEEREQINLTIETMNNYLNGLQRTNKNVNLLLDKNKGFKARTGYTTEDKPNKKEEPIDIKNWQLNPGTMKIAIQKMQESLSASWDFIFDDWTNFYEAFAAQTRQEWNERQQLIAQISEEYGMADVAENHAKTDLTILKAQGAPQEEIEKKQQEIQGFREEKARLQKEFNALQREQEKAFKMQQTQIQQVFDEFYNTISNMVAEIKANKLLGQEEETRIDNVLHNFQNTFANNFEHIFGNQSEHAYFASSEAMDTAMHELEDGMTRVLNTTEEKIKGINTVIGKDLKGGLNKIGGALNELNRDQEVFLEKFKLTDEIGSTIQLAGALGQIVAMVPAFLDLKEFWNDESVSNADKLSRTLTVLASTAIAISYNFGHLQKTAKGVSALFSIFSQPGFIANITGAITLLNSYSKGMHTLNPALERQAAITIRMNQLWALQAKTLKTLNEEEKEKLRIKILQQATGEADYLVNNKALVKSTSEFLERHKILAKIMGLWGKGITFFKGSVLKLVGAISATVAGIALLSVAIYKLVQWYNKDAIAAEKAAEKVKDLKTAYDEARESADKFKGAFDNYNTAIANMKKLEKGTLEYKEAVLEANEKALALLETHEMLAQYANYEDGVISFNEEGMNKLLEQQILKSQYMQIDYLTGLIRSKEAQDRADITAFQRDNKYNDYDGQIIYETVKKAYADYNGQVSEEDLWDPARKIKNADGTYSTVASFSTSDVKEGVEVLLSTIVKDATGKYIKISEDQAKEYYRQTGGANSLGEFANPARATVFAEALHEAQDYYFKGALGEYKLMSQKVSEELIRDIANYMYENNQTKLFESELLNIESFATASTELKNSILGNIEQYEALAVSLNESRRSQELFSKQAAESYLKMKGIIDDDGKMTVEEIVTTNLFTQYQGPAPSTDLVEQRIKEQSTSMPGLDSQDKGGQSDLGDFFYENEADAMRKWYEDTYGTTLKQSWWSKWFFGDKDYKKSAEFDIYDETGAKTDKKIKLEDIARLYYGEQIKSETAEQAKSEAVTLAPKVKATAQKASSQWGDALSYIFANSTGGKVTDNNALISQEGAQAVLDNWEAIKTELDNSDIYKDLGFKAEEDFLNGVKEYAEGRAKISDASALGADTIKTWNSHTDTVISEALSGDLTSGKLTETFTMLTAEAEKLKSLYPELGVAVDTFTSKGLIGTEQWYQALYQIEDKLHELKEESVKSDFTTAYDEIQNKFKDGDQINIQAWLDSDNFESELDDILDKDYAVNVEIHAQAEDYFDTFDLATDNLLDSAAKIGEGYVIAAEDIREVGNAFPGILNGMQKAEDGSVKLKKSMVQSATEAAKKELQISAETTVDKLENQAAELRGKQAIYKGMYEAALALQKKDADVEAETKKIKEGFQELENQNDADSTEQKQDNQEAVANDSMEQGRVVAENWSEAYESAADSAIAFAKTAVSAHEAAESGDINKISKGDFGVNYTGRAAVSSEGAKLAELKTDFENATTEEDYDKLAQSFKNAMDALGKQATDVESMAAEVSARYLEAINSLNNIGAGKGKDGGKDSKDPGTAELEDKYDIYHDINIEIKQITNSLDRLEEKEKEVFGTELVENLKNQIQDLDAQVNNYSEKLSIAHGEAYGMASTLRDNYGFLFNEDGTIANYKEVYENEAKKMKAVYDKYNSMSAKEQEKYEETKEAAEKRWEAFLEELERYDTLMTEEIPDILKAQREAENSKIEKQIKKFDLEIEIRLDMTEAEKDWQDFKKKMMYDDNDIWANANANLESLGMYYNDNEKGIIQVNTQHVRDVQAELEKIDKTGVSDVYGNDRVKALEDLKKYYSQLMKDLETVNKTVKEIRQSYVDMMKEAQSAFDEQVSTYEQISKIYNHGMKLTELIYGEKAYDQLEQYYKKLEKNNREQIDFQRQEVEFWKEQMDSLDPIADKDAWETAKANWQRAVSDFNSQLETSVENIKDKYLNAIEVIFEKLNNKVTDGKGLEYVSEEWDLLGQNSEEFLDEINSLYGIEDIARKYQDAIDETDNLTTQKKLREVMEEELEALREKDKLTEYDIERAEKKYDLTLKQIALEEAQQNKSQLRLRRDSQGNYTYQYVADSDEISKAEEELAKARNELYNFDLEQYKSKLGQLYDVYEEYQNKMKEAAQINDPQERAERELLLQQQYGELINGLVEQNEDIRNNLYESAFEELAALRNKELEDYTQLTQKEKDLLMSDLIPQWDSGVQHMADVFAGEGGFIPTCEESMEELDEATEDYERDLNQLERTAKVDFDSIYDGIHKTALETRDLVQDNSELISKYEEELTVIGNLVDQLDGLVSKYGEAEQAAYAATEAAYKYWRTANNETADAAGADKHNYPKDNSQSNEIITEEQEEEEQPLHPGPAGNGILAIGEEATYIGGTGGWWENAEGKGTHGLGKTDKQVVVTQIVRGYDFPIHINDAVTGGALGWVKIKSLTGYDTGGYTGAWGDEGKLALLHQKELVLNAQDTKNMLNAVDILRDITNTIGSTMLNKLAQLNGNANGLLSHVGAETMEQNVHIDATFPNVQNSKEIEEAFKNLTNIAAQRAFRS